MLCALSGQTIVTPVVSPVSGKVYEKATVEAWIAEKGTDPVSHQPLRVDQLIEMDLVPANPELVKSASIPSLLQALQTEFNALVLENHELTQNLKATRREVDAALRVITRLQNVSIDSDDNRTSPAKRQKHNNNDDDMNGEPSTASSIPETRTPVPQNNSDRHLPSIEECMKLHFLDIASTKRALNAKRKQFNKQIEQDVSAATQLPTDITFLNTTNARGVSPTLRVLGSFALTSNKLLDLNSDSETKLRGTTFWVNESTLCLVQAKKIQLMDTQMKDLPDGSSSAATSEKILDIVPHPAGYLLGRKSHGITMYQLFGLDVVMDLEVRKCSGMALHPDGGLLFTSSQDQLGTIAVHSLPYQEEAPAAELDACDGFASNESVVTNLTTSPNGYFLAYVLDGTAIGILDLRYEDKPQLFPDIGKARVLVKSLCFDDSGLCLLASAGTNGVSLFRFDSDRWTHHQLTDKKTSAVAWHKESPIGLS